MNFTTMNDGLKKMDNGYKEVWKNFPTLGKYLVWLPLFFLLTITILVCLLFGLVFLEWE